MSAPPSRRDRRRESQALRPPASPRTAIDQPRGARRAPLWRALRERRGTPRMGRGGRGHRRARRRALRVAAVLRARRLLNERGIASGNADGSPAPPDDATAGAFPRSGWVRSSAPGRSPRWSAPSRPRPASLRTRDPPSARGSRSARARRSPRSPRSPSRVRRARGRGPARDRTRPSSTWGVATWAMATFLALASLGAFLRATTHHHGLAGVTFAIGGLAVGGALALVVRRLMQMARGADPWGARRSW